MEYPPLPLKRLCHNMKKRHVGKRERQLAEKDLGRQPLTILIQGPQPYDNIRYHTNDHFPYLKDPHSKSLEPNCLSLRLFNCDTVSKGGGVRERVLLHELYTTPAFRRSWR